jgi:hypothetical protein
MKIAADVGYLTGLQAMGLGNALRVGGRWKQDNLNPKSILVPNFMFFMVASIGD